MIQSPALHAQMDSGLTLLVPVWLVNLGARPVPIALGVL